MASEARHRSARTARSVICVGATCLGALCCAASVAGCSDWDLPSVVDRDPEQAVATLKPTRNRRAWGIVKFESTRSGLRIHADVSGLPRLGQHALHVHEEGDCSAPDASSAGGHFNFDTGQQPRRIAGNLGDLEAGSTGRAVLEAVIPRAELEGERSLVGRAVIVHERGNDPSVPLDGDAGSAIACGVIASPDAARSSARDDVPSPDRPDRRRSQLTTGGWFRATQ